MILIGKSIGSQGKVEIKDTPLGTGGEGSVYDVVKQELTDILPADKMVAKIYHKKNDKQRLGKIITMLQNRPDDSSVAWPLALLIDSNKNFYGYLMEKLDSEHFQPWLELSDAKSRKKIAPDFDVKYALMACRNLAAALASIHKAGHMVGDVNESNIFVSSESKVLIVDTDSAQIKGKDGRIFPCEVGKPEYTAPEISHGALRDNPRTPATDNFALAIVIFQMLTGGSHPTDGKYNHNDEPPDITNRIRRGIYPALGVEKDGFTYPDRVPTNAVPKVLQKTLLNALAVSPDERISLSALGRSIDDSLRNLVQCSKVKQHWFDKRDGVCGWCQHIEKGFSDPWSNTVPQQKRQNKQNGISQQALPPIGFNNQTKGPRPSRIAPQVAGPGITPTQNISSPPMSSTLSAAVPVQTPQFNDGSQQQPPTIQQQPTVNQVPDKIKGKTVLRKADGSYIVRPPLSELFKSQPKLALSCFFDELPDIMKFWWPKKRNSPQWTSNAVGFVLSFFMFFMWMMVLPNILNQLIPEFDFKNYVVSWGTLVSSISSFLFTIICVVSGIVSSIRNRKASRENPFASLGRYIFIGLFYGPLFIVIALVFVIGLIVVAIASSIKKENEGNRYDYH